MGVGLFLGKDLWFERTSDIFASVIVRKFSTDRYSLSNLYFSFNEVTLF